jgi:cytochrome c556
MRIAGIIDAFRARSVRVTLALTMLVPSLACEASPKASQHAAPPTTNDPRTAVALPPDAQQAVLREMRQMLAAIGGSMSGAARKDTAAVLAALAPAGSAAAADPAIEALLPPTWKELAERTHGGFDSLSAAVRRTRTDAALKDTVLAGLARVSGSCTACHETFRVTVR